jgi:flagellar P-ring protein precursor FlgI
MKAITLSLILTTLVAGACAQTTAAKQAPVAVAKPPLFKAKQAGSGNADTNAAFTKATTTGITARLKDVARFRGIRSNRLEGIGLVVGLNGTGDSKNVTATATALANYMKKKNIDVDLTTLQIKNAAIVQVTADLPPFAVNGQVLDITVSSLGDAKSLRNGTLVLTQLTAANDSNVVYATASGQISVGGFSEGAGGNAAASGFVTVGRIPRGATVEHDAPTTTLHDGKMFIELDQPDLTTAHRVEARINETYPEFAASAIDGGTIQVTLPTGQSALTAMAKLEMITVQVDTPSLVVINEKTGTIVMGGDVRLAPCAVATGSLSVKVDEVNSVSQPEPLSNGTTTPVKNQTLTAGESNAQIAVLKANTTIADLARIFQELKLKPADIINILQMLSQQGALKARVVTQ